MLLSYYLIYTAAQWTSKLKLAGDEGAAIIERKIELIRKYMLTAWDIDIDELRDVLQRRINDVVAGKIDIVSIAKACGYPNAVCVDNCSDLDRELVTARDRGALSLIEVKCSIGSREDLGRPTTTALENKQNFMSYLQSL